VKKGAFGLALTGIRSYYLDVEFDVWSMESVLDDSRCHRSYGGILSTEAKTLF